MSKELAEEHGLKIGEKVIYPNHKPSGYLDVVTVKDVVKNWNNEIVVLTEELEGYVYTTDIYTKDAIIKMLE